MTQFRFAYIVCMLALCLFPPGGHCDDQVTINVCNDITDPLSIVPFRQNDERSYGIICNIFDGLTRFDAEGNLKPSLAVRWERISPLKTKFYLRTGVTFHNGAPFDAESVRFTVEKVLAPETQSPVRMMFPTLKSVSIVDAHTVILETSVPDGLLLYKLGVYLKMLPPRYFVESGESGFTAQPVGTGPFVFKEWEKGQHIILHPHSSYWMDGVPDSSIGEVRFRFVPMEQQLNALLSGKLDLITDMPGIYTYQVVTNPSKKVVKRESLFMFFAVFNNISGPMTDLKVRKAVNHAIDRKKLIKYGARGNGLPLAAYTMPGEFGHNDELTPYEYDIELARHYLHEAGYPQGISLEASCLSNARVAGDIIVAQLAKADIHVNLTYVNRREVEVKLYQPKFDPSLPKWHVDLNIGFVPNGICHSLFLHDFAFNSRSPFSLMADEDVDRLLLAAKTEIDPQRQEALCKEVARLVHDRAYALFGYQIIKTYGVSKTVDFTPHITGIPDLRGISVP